MVAYFPGKKLVKESGNNFPKISKISGIEIHLQCEMSNPGINRNRAR